MNSFYVYVHKRKSDGLVFYVGKGQDQRAWKSNRSARSKDWINVAEEHGFDVFLFVDGVSEELAFSMEALLIYTYRMFGHPLVNKSNGGHGGSSGSVRSKETRARIRDINGGMPVYCSNGMYFDSYKDACRWLRSIGHIKATGSGIRDCVKNGGISAYGYAWSSESVPSAPDLKARDAEKLRIITSTARTVFSSDGVSYPSINAAARDMASRGFDTANGTAIRNALNGNTHSAYGMAWSYDDVPDEPDMTPLQRTAETLTRRFGRGISNDRGESFRSINEAIRFLKSEAGFPKAVKTNISRSADLNGGSVSYGRRWEWS